MNDERDNRPSASSFERLLQCPPSHRMALGIPDTTSPEANEGNRIHSWLSGSAEQLTDDEQECADKCNELAGKLRETTFAGSIPKIYIEERFWFEADGKKLFSGKFDYLAINKAQALLIDYKTGRVPAVEASKNLQLRSMVAILTQHFYLESVRVAIIQPRAHPQVTECVYDASAMRAASDEMLAIVQAADDANQSVRAGSHCKYCKAKIVCPAAQCVVVPGNVNGTAITNVQLSVWLEHCDTVDMFIEAIREESKRRDADNPGCIPGWGRVPNAPMESIVDWQSVVNKATAAGVTNEQLTDCFSMKKTALQGALKLATGKKGKALDESLRECLFGATRMIEKQPSFKRLK